MSWSMDAVRSAWGKKERDRYNAEKAAWLAANPAGRMDAALQNLASALDSDSPVASNDSVVPNATPPRYVRDVFNDFILVDADNDSFGPDSPATRVNYTVDDTTGTITFGDEIPVKITYVPETQLTPIHRVLLSRDDADDSLTVSLSGSRSKVDGYIRRSKGGKNVLVKPHARGKQESLFEDKSADAEGKSDDDSDDEDKKKKSKKPSTKDEVDRLLALRK